MTGSGLAIRRIIPDRGWPGRNGLQVSHIDLHIMVGTLAGSDKWFRQVSAASHYGVGGGGLVYQWIDENDGSWADANRQADCTGVTIEHEGGMAGVPMTDACVEASARLCADISRRYQLGRLWHDESGQRNGNVWLHREIPGTDHFQCPDLAVNGLPYQRVIELANQYLDNNDSQEDSDMTMACIIQPNGENRLIYYDGHSLHNLTHPDQVTAIQQVAKATTGKELPIFKLGTKTAPWFTRLKQAVDAKG